MKSRTPNLRLRSLLDETGWTGQAFAHAVNAEGRRSALVVRYDRTAVAHWLAGTRPREQVCEVICRVLTHRLGRTVRPEDAGLAPGRPAGRTAGPAGHPGPDRTPGPGSWPGPGPGPDPESEQATAGPGSFGVVLVHERLRELAENGTVARRVLQRLPYAPVMDLPFAAGGPPPPDSRERIGSAHIRGAELMVGLFALADEVFGGVRLRPALTSYLSTDIAARLCCPASPSVSRRFRQASGDLAYLAGFMSFDENLHGVAQAYFQLAVRLSAEANDPARYAIAVRQMSVQAYGLGNPGLALQFAQEATRDIGRLPAQAAASVVGQEALALAGSGRRRAALAGLGRAERLLERAEGQGAVLGGYHLAAFTHQQAEVLAAAGDLPAACTALAASLRLRPPQERRARMLTTARLAGLQLSQGQLELACSTWERFLDDYPLVSSARGDAALGELRRGLRSYRREPAARRVLARAGRVVGAAGGSGPGAGGSGVGGAGVGGSGWAGSGIGAVGVAAGVGGPPSGSAGRSRGGGGPGGRRLGPLVPRPRAAPEAER
ncbi:hypothetical protein ACIRBX_24370 [Kitasatospora sp. NPDC096147]|uniref:hypothetical protein n=1 Tax=Kitasatospora sp. NPDC096147 TaxID=3364093 RepID=UPI00382BD09E